MEIKNVKVSKLENKELLDVKKQVESFLKFLNSEYDTEKIRGGKFIKIRRKYRKTNINR